MRSNYVLTFIFDCICIMLDHQARYRIFIMNSSSRAASLFSYLSQIAIRSTNNLTGLKWASTWDKICRRILDVTNHIYNVNIALWMCISI